MVEKIPYVVNLMDHFNKTLIGEVFDSHKDNISVRCVCSLL